MRLIDERFYGHHPEQFFQINTGNVHRINKVYLRFKHKNSYLSFFAQADTGSEVNVITLAYLRYLQLDNEKQQPSSIILDTFGDNKIPTHSSVTLNLQLTNSKEEIPIKFLIQEENYIANATIGQNFLRRYNIDLDFSSTVNDVYQATSLTHEGPYYGLKTTMYSNSHTLLDVKKETIFIPEDPKVNYGPPKINILTNNTELEYFVDTGAMYSIIEESVIRKQGWTHLVQPTTIRMLNGASTTNIVEVQGQITLQLFLKTPEPRETKKINHTFLITNGSGEMQSLGIGFYTENEITHSSSQDRIMGKNQRTYNKYYYPRDKNVKKSNHHTSNPIIDEQEEIKTAEEQKPVQEQKPRQFKKTNLKSIKEEISSKETQENTNNTEKVQESTNIIINTNEKTDRDQDKTETNNKKEITNKTKEKPKEEECTIDTPENKKNNKDKSIATIKEPINEEKQPNKKNKDTNINQKQTEKIEEQEELEDQTGKEQIPRKAETNKDKEKNPEDEKTNNNDKIIQPKDKKEDKEINKLRKNNQQSKEDAKTTTNKKIKTKTGKNDDEEGEEYLYEILKKLDNEPQCEYDLFEEEKEIEENTETIEVYTDRTIYIPRNAGNVMIPIGITHKHKKTIRQTCTNKQHMPNSAVKRTNTSIHNRPSDNTKSNDICNVYKSNR